MRLASTQLSGYFAFTGYHHVQEEEKEEQQRLHIRGRHTYSQMEDRGFDDCRLRTAQIVQDL